MLFNTHIPIPRSTTGGAITTRTAKTITRNSFNKCRHQPHKADPSILFKTVVVALWNKRRWKVSVIPCLTNGLPPPPTLAIKLTLKNQSLSPSISVRASFRLCIFFQRKNIVKSRWSNHFIIDSQVVRSILSLFFFELPKITGYISDSVDGATGPRQRQSPRCVPSYPTTLVGRDHHRTRARTKPAASLSLWWWQDGGRPSRRLRNGVERHFVRRNNGGLQSGLQSVSGRSGHSGKREESRWSLGKKRKSQVLHPNNRGKVAMLRAGCRRSSISWHVCEHYAIKRCGRRAQTCSSIWVLEKRWWYMDNADAANFCFLMAARSTKAEGVGDRSSARNEPLQRNTQK